MQDTPTKPRPRRRLGPFATLRAFFDKTGVRQSDIADNVGISETHMSNIVSGKRTPSLGLAKKLSRETNVPVEAIGADAP
jgi:antitoxin component HigA of HigAB toxin-antitoxin module